MKRGLYVTLGVILLVVGIALAALGTTVALSVGSDDSIATAPARVRGTGVAVVAEDLRVDTSALPVPDDLGTLTLTVTGRNGREMFVGAATTTDIDTYLTGAPYDVVVDLTAGQKATTRKVPGSQQPQPPGTQGFWAVQASGAPAVLTGRVPRGETLVVMNADGAPVVDADIVVTLRVPKASTYSWIAAAVGVVLALLALLLFWRARVAGRRRRAADAVGAQVPGEAEAEAATVLPGSALDAPPLTGPPTAALAAAVSVAPTEEDVVVAPPSAGLAALVAEAALADEGSDPLFDELVAAHGADPVHDELPGVVGVAPEGTGPAAPDADDPSGAPTSGG